MKIAQKSLYFHTPYRMLLGNIETVKELGINCEIYVDGNVLDTYTQDEISCINSTFEKCGLSKIVHGPFLDLNPGSRDPKVRALAKSRFIAALEFSRDIKANHIVFHAGFSPIYYRDSSDLFLDLSMDVWQEVLDAATGACIVVSIENSIEPTPEIIIKLLTRINSSNFRACFDIGHFNAFGKKSIFECLKEYPPGLIDEIHLSDNNGDFDSHLVLGEGNIDFAGFFSQMDNLSIKPILTSEPHAKEDIGKNLKYLLELSD